MPVKILSMPVFFEMQSLACLSDHQLFCCCFVTFHTWEAAMDMSGQSLDLSTLFLGRLRLHKRWDKRLTSNIFILGVFNEKP